MQFKVRVKTNDNDNVEEWVPTIMLLGPLRNTVRALGDQIDDLVDESVSSHHIMAVAFQEIEILHNRIERLEQIILNMAQGNESSGPDKDHSHTHWNYPLNGAGDLVKEIAEEHQAEANASLTGSICSVRYGEPGIFPSFLCTECESEQAEEYEDEDESRRKVNGNFYCPMCGEQDWGQHYAQRLCTECESELAEEQATLADFGALSNDDEIPF